LVEGSRVESWARNVVTWVSRSEGPPDALNRNLDGQGLSFGVLQWTQRSGNLGVLLGALFETDPTAFAATFGPSWARVLEAARRGSLEPVDGARLWDEPWATRFIAAGRHPPFVEAQWRLAASGEHWRGAESVAARFGVRTERAMALFFDRSVHQGPAGARRVAEQLIAAYARAGRTSVPYLQLLVDYGALAAAPFRRRTAPASAVWSASAPHLTWQPVGGEWHAVTGPFDLYALVVKRTGDILRTAALADTPLPAPAAA
jgi:hypothetical protein